MDINQTGLDSVSKKNYQKFLEQQSNDLLAGKDSISLSELKKTSLFSSKYNSLNTKGKMNFDKLAGLDGDSSNVSKEELKMYLAMSDADLNTKANTFQFDGKFNSVQKGKSGFEQMSPDEINGMEESMKQGKLKTASEKIIGEMPDVDFNKIDKHFGQIDKNYQQGFQINQIVDGLKKRNVQYNLVGDNQVEYVIGGKKYSSVCTDVVTTTVTDMTTSKPVQQFVQSNLRNNTNGIEVSNFNNDGQKTESCKYNQQGKKTGEVTSYNYDSNGKLAMSLTRLNPLSDGASRTTVDTYKNGDKKEYLLFDDVLRRSSEKRNYSDEDLLNP